MCNMKEGVRNAELETLLEYNSAEDFSDTDRQVAKFFTSLFK